MPGQARAALAQISGNACARRQLSHADRNRIYGALDAGVRPSDVATRLERILLRTIHAEPKLTYSELQKRLDLNISRATYHRVLVHHNIRKWLAKKRPALTEDLAANRLAWARIHVTWTAADWARIWFPDEASIELSRGKKRVWVFRTPSQKWDTNMIDPSAKGKQISVMI
jgi:hypothetical protein